MEVSIFFFHFCSYSKIGTADASQKYIYTSRMPSIVGEQERASWNKQMLILNDSLTWFFNALCRCMYMDRRSFEVATFATAVKVQC